MMVHTCFLLYPRNKCLLYDWTVSLFQGRQKVWKSVGAHFKTRSVRVTCFLFFSLQNMRMLVHPVNLQFRRPGKSKINFPHIYWEWKNNITLDKTYLVNKFFFSQIVITMTDLGGLVMIVTLNKTRKYTNGSTTFWIPSVLYEAVHKLCRLKISNFWPLPPP